MSEPGPPSPATKTVNYEAVQPYCTYGERSGSTQTVWVVFHGIGYLSRYFLKHFNHLDPAKNYIVAPQAPSLYYLKDTYTHVGACWLTRERTAEQMENLLRYLDAMAVAEELNGEANLRLFGYSQGVSVLCRWVARRKIPCRKIQLYAGRIPDELTPADFLHLPGHTEVELLWGDADPYLESRDRDALVDHARELFGDRLKLTLYAGGHELQRKWIAQ